MKMLHQAISVGNKLCRTTDSLTGTAQKEEPPKNKRGSNKLQACGRDDGKLRQYSCQPTVNASTNVTYSSTWECPCQCPCSANANARCQMPMPDARCQMPNAKSQRRQKCDIAILSWIPWDWDTTCNSKSGMCVLVGRVDLFAIIDRGCVLCGQRIED